MSKFIRIERNVSGTPDRAIWKLIPNGERIRLLEKISAAPVDAAQGAAMRHIFHIHHMPGIVRGNRLTYLGLQFRILEISDSPKLLGLELLCEQI